jgi:hypothetical protein
LPTKSPTIAGYLSAPQRHGKDDTKIAIRLDFKRFKKDALSSFSQVSNHRVFRGILPSYFRKQFFPA